MALEIIEMTTCKIALCLEKKKKEKAYLTSVVLYYIINYTTVNDNANGNNRHFFISKEISGIP